MVEQVQQVRTEPEVVQSEAELPEGSPPPTQPARHCPRWSYCTAHQICLCFAVQGLAGPNLSTRIWYRARWPPATCVPNLWPAPPAPAETNFTTAYQYSGVLFQLLTALAEDGPRPLLGTREVETDTVEEVGQDQPPRCRVQL